MTSTRFSPAAALASPAVARYRIGRRLARLLALSVLLAGCSAQPYRGTEIDGASFLQRALTQENGPIRVTAAVPDDAETEVLTGLDLYDQGIQPVWVKV